jgi:LIM domain kinase 1
MRRCGNCTPTNTVVTEKVEDTKIENKKIEEPIENNENKKRPIEDTKIEEPIENKKRPIEDTKIEEPIEDTKIEEPIEDVNTAVVIQKPKFQKKTPEQLKEDRRIRKQKQRETLKVKLGVEEYNKLRAKEIATNRDTKKNNKP